ncbi:carboxymuconolactone decarboxylase family protein [Nocardioides sp. LHG3406-4]|uniref:carboxymuconolactone decarboxylase family protein n=1 Tax=Nocardioides sp. LHG3406-4 TaxID=2804575 RepID=UPI003CF11C6E
MTKHDHSHGPEVLDDLKQPSADLRRLIPDVYAGYVAMSGAAMADGALDVRAKELIALAIAISKQCDGCMAAHARGLVKAGATDAEVAEAIGVAIMMNGGPGTVYGPRALAAFREFKEQSTES